MSDGPHRSLNMGRDWKRLAERADTPAFASEEVRDAFQTALEGDWRKEVPPRILQQVRTMLQNPLLPCSSDQATSQLEVLRRETAGSALGDAFLNHAIQAVHRGLTGVDGLRETACNALMDRAMRGKRQVEEHYLRKSRPSRVARLRDRIESVVTQSNILMVADRILQMKKSEKLRRPLRQTGLDEGVQL